MPKPQFDPTPKRATMMQPLVAFLKRRLLPHQRKLLIEIGSFCGASTEVFAGIFDRVIAVDAWDASLYPKGSPDAIAINGQKQLSQAEKTFDAVMARCGNIEKIKMPSVKAAELLGQSPVVADALYVDAQHDFDGCYKDLTIWSQFVKRLAMGHDYGLSFPGVVQAVKKFYGTPQMLFKDNSWVVDLELQHIKQAPMDAHEFHQKMAGLGHVNKVALDPHYEYQINQGMWSVSVIESNECHAVFGGAGYTIEEANRTAWEDALMSYDEYDYQLPAIFVDEAKEIRNVRQGN